MTPDDPTHILEETRELIDLLLDGTLPEPQRARLEHLVIEYPAAADLYLNYMQLQAAIPAHAPGHAQDRLLAHLQSRDVVAPATSPGPAVGGSGRPTENGSGGMFIRAIASTDVITPPSSPPAWKQARDLMEKARRRPAPWGMRGMAAAIVILATSLAWIFFAPRSPQIVMAPNSPTSPAYISPTTGVAAIVPVELQSGFTRLTLDGGVKVLIEGPARYSIVTDSHLRLHSGRLTAIVPHGVVGFTVETTEAKITDLGTEFGVEAGYNFTEIEVFDGRVAVGQWGDAGVREVLSAGQAEHVAATGQIQQIEAGRGRLVRIGGYDARQAAETRAASAFEQWSAFSRELRHDSSLVLYYPFETSEKWPDELLNCAQATQGLYDGTIKQATWCQGRFPGKRALAFDGKDSRVELNVPPALEQLTVAMWARIDRWENDRTGLLMSDDWNRKGELHFQFLSRRLFQTAVFTDVRHGENASSFFNRAPAPIGEAGQWMCLAATLDSKTGAIAQYCNGQLISSGQGAPGVAVKIGSAQIGNWDPVTIITTSRALRGQIDELAIFNRVLSRRELERFYEEGMPSP